MLFNIQKMKKFLWIILFLGMQSALFSQEDTLFQHERIEDKVFDGIEELVLESESDEIDYADNLELLLQYQNSKINLNELSPEVAYNVLQLTDYQYYQLQLYIEVYGELVTIYELAAVDGFERETIDKFIDYVEVKPSKNGRRFFTSFWRRSRQTLLLRYSQILEPQAGYEKGKEDGYLGNPMRLTFKYSFQSGQNFAMALSGEKDAGEEFFRGTQNQGFDHYAFYMNFKNLGVLKNCVIGDYNLNFGQGLVFGSRSMGSKGGGAAQIRRFATLIRPAAPMNESTHLRGVAVTLGNAQYMGTVFYSHRFFDGDLFLDEDSNSLFDGSLSISGYHRTLGEIEQQNKLQNRVYGANFQMKRRIFSLGATVAKTDFLAKILPAEELYRQFDFSGRSMCNLGVDYKVIVPKGVLFGEFGVSRNGGVAFLQGGVFDISPLSKVALLFRYYDKKYVALNSSAFGENSLSHNEIGLYVAADFILTRNMELSVNGDYYYFPWLRFRADKPTNGFDISSKLNWSICRNLEVSLKYQYKLKEANYRVTDYYQTVFMMQQHKFRCGFNFVPIPMLKMKTEIDYVINKTPSNDLNQGILLFQDVGIMITKWNLEAKMRFAFFDMDSYEERIYAYEQDFLYTFTVNGYYGKGVRIYLMLNYGYSFFDIQLRVGQTYYDDKITIGSGRELIMGNHKSEVKAQIIFHIG